MVISSGVHKIVVLTMGYREKCWLISGQQLVKCNGFRELSID